MGPTQYVRGTAAEQSAYDHLVTEVNQLIVDLDTFVASLNAADGGPITAAHALASRLRIVAQVPPLSTGTSLDISDGDGQTGTVATALTDPLVVALTDSNGAPLVGVEVLWEDQSDGQVTASVFTNASGLASVQWILGTVAGAQSATATVPGVGTVTFDATASAGPAATISIVSGNDQSAEVSTALAEDCVVLVQDQYSNPVAGETVTGAVTVGGGSLDDTTIDTDSDGLAAFAWTLGSSAGSNQFTATLDDVAGDPAVTFSASGQDTALTPDTLVAQSNGTQTNKVAGAAGDAITFRLTDGVTAVEGERIDFTGDSGSLDVDHDFTDASGDVTVTPTSAGFPVGTMTITATLASNPSLTATATVTTVAGTATKVLVVQQPPSNHSTGVLNPQPTFEITDANGNRKLTATNNCTLSKLSGSGTLGGTVTVAAVAGLITYTDISLTGASTVNVLRATVSGLTVADTNSVTLAPPVPFGTQIQEPITGAPVGGTVTIIVHVVDEGNVIVPNATNTVTIAKASGPGTMSGTLSRAAVSGVATFSVTFDTEGDYTVSSSSSGLAGDTMAGVITIAEATPTPNQPVGYTRFAEHDCLVIPIGSPNGSATGLDGIWGFPSGSQDNDIESFDPLTYGLTAPSGNSRVWRVRYPTNQNIGQSSIKIFGWDNSITGTATGYSSLYWRWWVYFYGNGTNFHFGVTQIKPFGYLGYGRLPANGAVGNDLYWVAGVSTVGDKTSFSLDTRQQGNVTRDIPGQVQVQIGQWYLMEGAATLNTLGSANGTLKQWLTPLNTGVANLWCNRSDMTWITTSNTQKFWKWHWANIYGGGGSGNGGCRPEYYLMDAPYFSGVTP